MPRLDAEEQLARGEDGIYIGYYDRDRHRYICCSCAPRHFDLQRLANGNLPISWDSIDRLPDSFGEPLREVPDGGMCDVCGDTIVNDYGEFMAVQGPPPLVADTGPCALYFPLALFFRHLREAVMQTRYDSCPTDGRVGLVMWSLFDAVPEGGYVANYLGRRRWYNLPSLATQNGEMMVTKVSIRGHPPAIIVARHPTAISMRALIRRARSRLLAQANEHREAAEVHMHNSHNESHIAASCQAQAGALREMPGTVFTQARIALFMANVPAVRSWAIPAENTLSINLWPVKLYGNGHYPDIVVGPHSWRLHAPEGELNFTFSVAGPHPHYMGDGFCAGGYTSQLATLLETGNILNAVQFMLDLRRGWNYDDRHIDIHPVLARSLTNSLAQPDDFAFYEDSRTHQLVPFQASRFLGG